MNAPHPPYPAIQVASAPAPLSEEEHTDLFEYWDILVDHRRLVATLTAVAIAIGAGYAFIAQPVYEANLLIQVEDSAGPTKNFLGEAASLFDVKTSTAGEIEIIRSRMVIGQAVDNTLLCIDARPRYLPILGGWLARHATSLSNPGFLGIGGFVSGTERIVVTAFDVPPALQGSSFRLIALDGGQFSLSHPDLPETIAGSVGMPLVRNARLGQITLLVARLDAKPGAEFLLTRRSRLAVLEDLQNSLKLAVKGRQSGVIEATLKSADPRRLTQILNEIGRQYVRQNTERKAAEAQKMLAFLGVQMPQFKKQLDESEEAYSRYRNLKGTISIDEEAKGVLNREMELQTRFMEAQQKRLELIARFTPEHPLVQTLDSQIAAWKREIASLNARVRTMPTVQQDALRLERDVKVKNEAYQNLRNNELQLQLMREGKVGNARLIDDAVLPEQPVWPKRPLIVALAAVLGLFAGVLVALWRNAMFRAIRNSLEIETRTGLSVYSTIPFSVAQQHLMTSVTEKRDGIHLLAAQSPHDGAVESLHSLRTALEFAMLDAPNNAVLITGAMPGVGKSFVSANLAAVLASAGKRVLLVDADLRKGHLNSYFGVRRENGLSEAIAGRVAAGDAVRRGLLPNLDVITTGLLPPNPAELMASAALGGVLDELAPQYDLVILDSPPVLVAADTLGMAAHVSTVLLVARCGETQLGELHESAKRLAHAGKSISGVLLNAIDLTRRYSGNYGSRYGGYRYHQYTYQSASK